MTEHEIKYMEIWLAYLPSFKRSTLKAGVRPVVVVSGNGGEQDGDTVTIVPLTSKLEERQQATHVLVRHGALHCTSRALCEQVMTLDRSRLLRCIGTLEGDWFTKLSIQHAMSIRLGMIA